MTNATESNGFARRATIKMNGRPDIKFELRRISAVDFEMIEDGKHVGPFWKVFSPHQLRSVHGPTSFSLDQAWESCLAKRFPGCVAVDVEDLVSND